MLLRTHNIVNAVQVLADSARDALAAHGCEVRDVPLADMPRDDMIQALADADAVIAGGERYVDAVFRGTEQLKIVARTGAGIDAVDLDAATRHGVWVTNTPGATNHAVADLTIGLILSLLRRIPEAAQRMKQGTWWQPQGREFGSLVLGVIGTGGIGREVIRRARGFGVTVLAHDLAPDFEFANRYQVNYVELDELLLQADIVTLHVCLSESTRNLLSRERLDLMKADSYVINTSRPAVLDQQVLIEKLLEGSLAGAAIDVHDRIPEGPADPLVGLENVIATPWYAYKTDEAIQTMSDTAVRDVLAVLDGRRPRFPVNDVARPVARPVQIGS